MPPRDAPLHRLDRRQTPASQRAGAVACRQPAGEPYLFLHFPRSSCCPTARWRIMNTHDSVITQEQYHETVMIFHFQRHPNTETTSAIAPWRTCDSCGTKPERLARRYLRFSPTQNPGLGRVGAAMMRCRRSCPRRDSTRSEAADLPSGDTGMARARRQVGASALRARRHRQRRRRRSAALWTARQRRTVPPPPVARGCSAVGLRDRRPLR